MKKLIFTVLIGGCMIGAASAQDGNKPMAGNKTAELLFSSPFASGNPFRIDNVRFRHFIADDMAVRIQFGITMKNQSIADDKDDPTSTATPPAKIECTDKEKLFNINIKPGIEKHFAGTERLSPYVGAEIDFAIQSASSVDEEIGGGTDGKGLVTTETKGKNNGGDKGYTRIGLNLLAGADYYITSGLYLGAEFGWGLQSVSYKDVETTVSGADPAVPATTTRSGSDFNLGTNFISSFRIGWWF